MAESIAIKSKKDLTAYWGISLSINILEHNEIKRILEENPQLIPLKNIHSTLLYVGKKEDDREKNYIMLEGVLCNLTITEIGVSEKAMALKVNKIIYINDDKIEKELISFPNQQQHITLALKQGIKPVDSVKTLLGEGTIIILTKPLIIQGHIKRYLF